MKVSQLFVLAAVVASLGGCQTLTEELPSHPTGGLPPIPVQPPVVVPVPIPVPETPTGGPPEAPPPPTSGNPNGQIPTNTNPVARVGVRVYFLECGGVQVPNSEGATQAQVGCRIHFDCTPRDAFNQPTQSQGMPNWSMSPGGLVSAGNLNEFTPTVTAIAAGNLSAYAVIDGVTSSTLNIQLYN